MGGLRTATLFVAVLLASCGKPLGTFQVENVSVVLSTAEPEQRVERPGSQMLRVEFTSRTDMYDASDGGGEGLYVLSSLCPYDANRTLYVGEPYYDDRSRYGPLRVLKREVSTDGRIREVVAHNDRRPMKNPRTGQFTYTTYLALDQPGRPEQPGKSEQIAYNLRLQPRDLCLRIDHPGYFVTPSRSQVFKVPAEMIQRALSPRI